jgi:tetratricopeptide (TPR) repeat protein
VAQLEEEHDNLRAALAWTLEQAAAHGTGAVPDREALALALRLAGALPWFWYGRGYLCEGRRWLEQALTVTATAEPDETLTLGRARAFNGAGFLALAQGEYVQARQRLEVSLELFQQVGATDDAAEVLQRLCGVARRQHDAVQVTALGEASLALFRAVGNAREQAWVLTTLGLVAQDQGDLARAKALLEESRACFQSLGASRGLAAAQFNLAEIALAEGALAHAGTLYRYSLRLFRELDTTVDLVHGVEGLAMLAAAEGQTERAWRLWGAAQCARAEMGLAPNPDDEARFERYLARSAPHPGCGRLGGPCGKGGPLSLEEAIAYALESACTGELPGQ